MTVTIFFNRFIGLYIENTTMLKIEYFLDVYLLVLDSRCII